VKFKVLGPVKVLSTNGEVLELTRRRQRSALGILLLNTGRRLSSDNLINALWGLDPPGDPQGALRSCIYGLRKTLNINGRLQTGANGYMVDLSADDQLDLQLFRSLSTRARDAHLVNHPAAVAGLLERALEMWEDPPLEDIPDTHMMQPVIAELVEQRHAAQEALIDAKLEMGLHAELLPSLRMLTASESAREHGWEQLMLALYRCGRRAEALDAFTGARYVLAEEYGIDPGRSLRTLQQRILAGDPSLDLVEHSTLGGTYGETEGAPARGLGAVVSRDEGADPVGPHQLPAAVQQLPVAPHQLPAAVQQFVGRKAELSILSQLAATASPRSASPVISVICGAPGSGKTALALQFAHEISGQFPDGQLYVDMAGFSPARQPVRPHEAIGSFLDALAPRSPRPAMSASAAAGLFRTMLADRRVLIVIDNAISTEQVLPLLPARPGCMVVVTSRLKLTGLVTAHGASLLTLDVLSEIEAMDLLSSRLAANRLTVDAVTAAELCDSCARLPLALAITATRAIERPMVPVSHLAEQLRKPEHRLDALSSPDPESDLRTVFSWSYEQLTRTEARVFNVLGARGSITTDAAACLANINTEQASRALSGLARAHLIAEDAPGRFRFNRLIGAYAAEKARPARRTYPVTRSSGKADRRALPTPFVGPRTSRGR